MRPHLQPRPLPELAIGCSGTCTLPMESARTMGVAFTRAQVAHLTAINVPIVRTRWVQDSRADGPKSRATTRHRLDTNE